LSDKAKKIGVNQPAIFYALKRMNFPWKKKQLRYRERNREERIKYYQLSLEIWSKKTGSKSLVFIDKSGFEDNQDCIYVWSKKGKKVYGEQERKRGKIENLVAGIRKKEKDLIGPIIFRGSLNTVGFKQ
jgi:putative transposase